MSNTDQRTTENQKYDRPNLVLSRTDTKALTLHVPHTLGIDFSKRGSITFLHTYHCAPSPCVTMAHRYLDRECVGFLFDEMDAL